MDDSKMPFRKNHEILPIKLITLKNWFCRKKKYFHGPFFIKNQIYYWRIHSPILKKFNQILYETSYLGALLNLKNHKLLIIMGKDIANNWLCLEFQGEDMLKIKNQIKFLIIVNILWFY